MNIDFKTLVIVGLIAFVALKGCDKGDAPQPEQDVATTAELAMESYARLCADEFGAVAKNPPEKATDFGEGLLAKTEAARKAAFKPVDQALQDAIGEDRYTPKKAAAISKEIAAGYRRAAE